MPRVSFIDDFVPVGRHCHTAPPPLDTYDDGIRNQKYKGGDTTTLLLLLLLLLVSPISLSLVTSSRILVLFFFSHSCFSNCKLNHYQLQYNDISLFDLRSNDMIAV